MTKLFLMRHGATEGNLRRPYTVQGRLPDPELAAAGLPAIRATAEALLGLGVTHIYSSPMRRARGTAAIVADRLGTSFEIDDGLVEADVGQWADLTWEEIERRWPNEFQAFRDDAERHGYLGGETMAAVRERVLPVVSAIVLRHPGDCVLIVGHGVVSRVLLVHWLGLPLKFARKLPHDNAGFSRVDFEDDGPRVRSVNEGAHLIIRDASVPY